MDIYGMSALELEAHFAALFKQPLPAIPERISTFFDVARFPKREVVVSNFYAYYFDPQAKHSFGTLFIDALRELIEPKGVIFPIRDENFTVEREVYVRSAGSEDDSRSFIDIALRDIEFDNGVVIENKIDAKLYNRLEKYLSTFRGKEVIGIVLSIRYEKSLPDKYVSVTHTELIKRITEKLGDYTIQADMKQLAILTEFVQNIKNMATPVIKPDTAAFFVSNQTKIRETHKLYLDILSHIYSEIEKTKDKINEKKEFHLTSRLDGIFKKFVSKKSSDLYFIIFLDDTYEKDGAIVLIVELGKSLLNKRDLFESINFHVENDRIINTRKKNTGVSYHHFAETRLDLKPEYFEDLSSTIYQKMESDGLLNIFQKIEDLLPTAS
jgi:PD-(D/E)XK nuclease superfamily